MFKQPSEKLFLSRVHNENNYGENKWLYTLKKYVASNYSNLLKYLLTLTVTSMNNVKKLTTHEFSFLLR